MSAKHKLGFRSIALTVATATMGALVLQAAPARATGVDPGVTELKQMVADVGTWTSTLAEAGKLAEKVPLVGSSAGSILGFPDLVQKAVSDQIDTLDTWGDYGATKNVTLGDGRTVSLIMTQSGTDPHVVTFDLTVSKSLTSEPFSFANEIPKVNLSAAGGVTVNATVNLHFAVGVASLPASVYRAYVINDAANNPHFSVDVSAALPTASPGLSAAIGILGVTATADSAHKTAEIHLVGNVDDPDGDGKLYRTMPDGAAGELNDLAAAVGLVHVGFRPAGSGGAGSIDVDLTITAASNASFSLPTPLTATVGIHWADISTGTPTVTATGLDPVAAFQRLTPRDLADMLGQLVSIINGSERSPLNKPLPFLSGSLADAAKAAEGLVDFLKKNVVQPPATPADPVDPAKVGEPSFRSVQELIQKLDDYSGTGDFAGATFEVSVGTYDTTTNRLPIDLKLKRTLATEIDLVKNTVAVTGAGTYTATTLADSTREFAAEIIGRRVIAGSSGGTIQSISADKHTLTLAGDGWVGGTPALSTTYSVSGPEVDAGTVNLANFLGNAGKKIVNANGIQPTAKIKPDYTARLKFALDLSAPKTGAACAGTPTGDPADPTATTCPFTRTNADGTHVVVTEVPLPVERLLIGTGYDLLTADFPASAGIDVYAKAGFLKVKIGGSVKVCRKTANADCTGAGTDPMLKITLNSVGSDPAGGYVPVAELFTSLIGAGVASRLTVATSVRGYATGSVSVPDAAAFLPGGGTATFTAAIADVTGPMTAPNLTVTATDLSEILNFDIDPTNPQALLGIVLRALQLLDEQLAEGDPSGTSVLSKKLPLVDLSMRDLLASDEAGGGLTVSYSASSFDADGDSGTPDVVTTKLTDSSRTGGRKFPDALVGRSVVVGTKVGIVLAVQDSGTSLQLNQLSQVPAAATPYFLRTELADAISLLSAAPPDSVQELVKILNDRLGHTTPFTFAYKELGGTPSLLVTLDWNRKFSRSSPIKFDVGGETLAGTAGSGTADVTVTTSLNAGVAIPLAIPAGGLTDVPLKILDNSQVSIDASASVNGTVRANLGPLALSLGNPDADTSNDATAKAHYKLGLSKSGGTADTASDLTTFLSGVSLNVNDYTGGVDCGEGTASPNEDLALCASLPFYLSTDGADTWTRLNANGSDLGINLRLPRAGSSVSDLFSLTGNVSTGDTRARLQAPSAADLAAAFSAALLNFGTIGDGLDAFLEMVQNALNDASQSGKLPLVGDDLQAGADFVGKLRTQLDALFAEVKTVNGGKLPDVATINTYLDTKFNEALTAAGADADNFELAITCLLKQSNVSAVTATVKPPPPPPVTDPPSPPSPPTPTPTTYTYGVIAVGTFNHADIDTLLGTTKSAANEAALSSESYNTITWSTRSNAQKYKVLRDDGDGVWHVVTTVTGSSYKDDGTDAPAAEAYTPPTEEATVDVCTGVQIYDVLGVVLRVDIGQGTVDSTGCSGDGCIENTIPLNIGIPGLSVRPSREDDTGGLTAKVGWHIHLALTLDKKDGFSILTKDQGLPEIGVGANIDLTSDLAAELAFLNIGISKHNDDGPALAAAFQIDLKSGSGEAACYTSPCAADPTKKLGLAELTGAETWSDVVDAQLNLTVNVDWLLKADIDAALPGIQARLVIAWNQEITASTLSNTELASLHIGFEDVALDAGGFLSGVLGPIVKELKSITGPVQPIIDVLYAPIPVLSDLSEMAGGPPVTLVTLAKAFSTIAGGPKLDFVDTVAKVITFVNNLPTGEGGDLLVPIGSFTVDTGQAWNVAATPDSANGLIDRTAAHKPTYKKKTGATTYVDSFNESDNKPAADIDSKSTPGKQALTSGVATGAGFKFPLLDNPGSIFNLVMGGDIDLVTFDSGPLTLGFTWRQSFGPVYAPPPVFITLSGSASVTARIVAGFDTYGLRKAFESGGTPSGIAQILNGLYFKSTDDSGAPLPVVTFYGEIAAGAAVSAVIITVGIEGGVSLTINLAWNDPNGDGKFRLFEFGQVALNNPICLFQMSGRIALFLRVYITLGFSPFSVSFSFTLADITLLDFNVKPDCDPPPPRLGGVNGTTLVVFAGKLGTGAVRGHSAWDNTGADYGDDVVKVTELHSFADDGTATKTGVKVEMLGITDTWADANIDRVVVDGRGYGHNLKVTMIGDGDKKKTSTASEVVPTGGFDLKAVVLGGDGDDVVKTGSGQSKVDGGKGKDTISLSDAPSAGPTWVAGGPGDDSITTGNASAIAAGDSAFGNRTGNQSLELRLADKDAPGDGAKVTIAGITNWGALTAPGGGEDTTDDANGIDGSDRIAVGRGANTVYGNAGDDAVGVAADSPVPGGPVAGANKIVLGRGSDTAKGGSNGDTIWTGVETGQARTNNTTRAVDGSGGTESANARNSVDTGAGNDTVFGGQGDDFVTTGSTSSQTAVVTGGSGKDVLLGHFGTDELFGGPGKDWVVAEPAEVGDSTGEDGLGTLIRPFKHLPLPAGTSSNTKVLVGGDGEDRIIGGDGAATIYGDRFEVEACGDQASSPESTPPAEPSAGSPGRDLITGGTGVDTVKAGGEADKVTTFAGNDLVCGQAGDDELYAGDDADKVWGGTGDDKAYGENGADSVYGNAGVDQLYGGNQNDVIEGNDGSDKGYGGSGDDTILGGTRNAGDDDQGDTLYGDTGDDTIIGDNGSDTYPYDLDGLTAAAGGTDTIWAGPGADKAYGGLANDTIYGGNDADHLEGNNATDTVYGEDGEDEIVGGSTESASSGVGRPDDGDALSGGNQNDLIVGDNAAVAKVMSGSTALIGGRGFTLGHSLGVLDLGDSPASANSGVDGIHGDAGNDVILGEGKGDNLFGDAGDDYVEGNAGADVISGGINADDIVGGSSPQGGGSQPDTGDTITGDQDDDVVLGDNGSILRDGTPVHPVTQGRGITERAISLLDLGTPAVPAPTATPHFGNDLVNGNDSSDVIFGEAGTDTLHGDASDDYIEGDQDADTITGDGGGDDLVGGSSTPVSGTAPTEVGQQDAGDTIHGNDDADVITGDNASVLRVGTFSPVTNRTGMSPQRAIQLQDLGNTATSGTSGDDIVTGDGGVDVVLGQGGGDALKGNADDDYLEGDQGSDLVEGNDGEDDVLGGGSALRSGSGSGESAEGQPDVGDYLYGGAGQDLVLGDNAVVLRAPAASASTQSALTSRYTMTGRSIRLLDLNVSGGSYLASVANHSGDDQLSGGSAADVLLGQDGADAMSGGPNEDWIEGNGAGDTIFGDQLLADTVPAGLAALRSTGSDLQGDTSEADGQDDLIGGSSNLPADSNTKTGRNGFRDAIDTIYGDGAADFELGDNGTLFRDDLVSGAYPRMTQRYALADTSSGRAIIRHAIRLDVPTNTGGAPLVGVSGADVMQGNAGEDFMWGQTGNDTMNGNDGNDDMYGELGDDTMFGDAGNDGMLGDRGGMVTRLVDGSAGDPSAAPFTMNAPPAETFQAFRTGMLDRRVDQLHDNAANASNTGSIDAFATGASMASDGIVKGGVDKMRGGLDRDAIHGEGGDDLLNGDSGGDIVFGDDGNDVMWGGRGCDPLVDGAAADCKTNGVFDDSARGTNDRMVDYLIAGNGGLPNKGSGGAPELIDWRPRGSVATPGTTCSTTTLPLTSGSSKNPTTVDPCSWFFMTSTDVADINVHQAHKGTDWMYGGWDRDVMEGDVAANGPNPGDRMIDWSGSVNLYNHCNSAYGGFNDVRQFSPEMQDFLQKWSYANGGGQTLTGTNGVLTPGTSGYNELGLVYNADVNNNSGAAYPTTPGHFEDFSCAP